MKEEDIENLIKGLNMESYPPRPKGGQNVGTFIQGIKITCPETGFEMVSTWYRSQMKNRDIIIKFYKEYLKEVSS
jgi:protein subunit release factor A